MKNIIIISLLLVLMSVKGFSQSNYNDYSENDKEKIFSDDFSTNNNAWSVGNFDCKIYTHSPGYFEMKSTCPDRATGHLVNYRNEFIINQTRNFEIETSIALISGDEIQSNGIAWGQNNMDNYFIFMFSANGTYSIYKRYNGTWETWKEVTSTSLIKKNNFNKLTIRKIDNKFYFFINNGFVHSCSFEPFLGQMLMFQGAQNSTIRIDYINISYLEKQQIVLSDYIAPEITITEPYLSQETKIFETNKQISIKGKATDNSGIYEVLINGLDANLDKYGNFEQNVNLAIGENQITVKATDIKNNSSYYKFYVNRQSNVIVQTNENIKTENEKRLALVIGNSNYGAGQTLKNPANDANLISTTLQSLGFEVIKRIDANKQSMEEAIRDFSKKLPNCNVALFYYAGHGVQVDGLNYIIPTDAKLNDKIDCKFEAVSINFIVEEFEHYPDNVNIVILDACRNNPFRSWARGGERGFRAISPTSGTIISFATSEGSTASDGKGNNGLFTEELVKQLVIPQAIESVFKKTRVQVQKRSNGSQSPQEWSQLTGDFYFKK